MRRVSHDRLRRAAGHQQLLISARGLAPRGAGPARRRARPGRDRADRPQHARRGCAGARRGQGGRHPLRGRRPPRPRAGEARSLLACGIHSRLHRVRGSKRERDPCLAPTIDVAPARSGKPQLGPVLGPKRGWGHLPDGEGLGPLSLSPTSPANPDGEGLGPLSPTSPANPDGEGLGPLFPTSPATPQGPVLGPKRGWGLSPQLGPRTRQPIPQAGDIAPGHGMDPRIKPGGDRKELVTPRVSGFDRKAAATFRVLTAVPSSSGPDMSYGRPVDDLLTTRPPGSAPHAMVGVRAPAPEKPRRSDSHHSPRHDLDVPNLGKRRINVVTEVGATQRRETAKSANAAADFGQAAFPSPCPDIFGPNLKTRVPVPGKKAARHVGTVIARSAAACPRAETRGTKQSRSGSPRALARPRDDAVKPSSRA